MGENSCIGSRPASNSQSKHPPLNEAMAIIRSLGIKKLSFLHPDHSLLKAFENTNVEVNLGIPNEDLLDLALSSEHACRWVSDNIKPYLSSLKIRYINVGNEVFMGEERLWHLVLPAMRNIYNALHSLDMGGLSIHVSTSVGMDVLGNWTSPWTASFLHHWTPFVQPILEFLAENKLPLMVNVFPYNVNQKNNGTAASSSYHWTNSLCTAVDAFYCAMEEIGYPSVSIVVSSIGWPSSGGEPDVAITSNALAYNQWLMRHQTKRFGTDKKPDLPIEAYLFTLINFVRYPGDKLEWGLFDGNMASRLLLLIKSL